MSTRKTRSLALAAVLLSAMLLSACGLFGPSPDATPLPSPLLTPSAPPAAAPSAPLEEHQVIHREKVGNPVPEGEEGAGGVLQAHPPLPQVEGPEDQ